MFPDFLKQAWDLYLRMGMPRVTTTKRARTYFAQSIVKCRQPLAYMMVLKNPKKCGIGSGGGRGRPIVSVKQLDGIVYGETNDYLEYMDLTRRILALNEERLRKDCKIRRRIEIHEELQVLLDREEQIWESLKKNPTRYIKILKVYPLKEGAKKRR